MAILSFSLLATANPSFVIEFRTDRAGMDYNRFTVNSMEECLNACQRDSQCQAFTYVSPGYQPPDLNNQSPICWLKDGVPSAARRTGMISGVRQ
ncbi:MAG: hypothetical protein HC840_24585 [Leptolyngbyaceae cyanobacterium RM2_2_4]|nr:hypothetical protein [Leptolyngbyaceae cyanobacterium SM1_4_3]NJN89866.1 hypothetical protein [Leptolyngbyaceae cyanobacterium SL_5_14]NJO52058.1 hypothetical protein [Leptolyngbyaceae cyanobacterium RM2_2_4]